MALDVRRGAGSAGDVGVARLLNKTPIARALAACGEEPGCRNISQLFGSGTPVLVPGCMSNSGFTKGWKSPSGRKFKINFLFS